MCAFSFIMHRLARDDEIGILFQRDTHGGKKVLWNRRVEYWAISSSARSFTCTAHSFACSVLLDLLARSAALIRSLPLSLTRSGAYGKKMYVYKMIALISCNFNPQCVGWLVGWQRICFCFAFARQISHYLPTLMANECNQPYLYAVACVEEIVCAESIS